MNEMFKMAGMDLPEYLGKDAEKDGTAAEKPAEEAKAAYNNKQ